MQIRNTANAPAHLRCLLYYDVPPPIADDVRPVTIDAFLKASGGSHLVVTGTKITGVVVEMPEAK